jgi:single-stranded DNA-specific DHH superfamily exonuclease
MTYDNTEFEKIVDRAAEQALHIALRDAEQGIDPTIYLYYKESTAETSGIVLACREDEVHRGFILVCPSPMRGKVSYGQYYEWIANQCRTLPVLKSK